MVEIESQENALGEYAEQKQTFALFRPNPVHKAVLEIADKNDKGIGAKLGHIVSNIKTGNIQRQKHNDNADEQKNIAAIHTIKSPLHFCNSKRKGNVNVFLSCLFFFVFYKKKTGAYRNP